MEETNNTFNTERWEARPGSGLQGENKGKYKDSQTGREDMADLGTIQSNGQRLMILQEFPAGCGPYFSPGWLIIHSGSYFIYKSLLFQLA